MASEFERRLFKAVRRVLDSAQGRVERRLAPGPIPQKRPELSLQHAYATNWRDFPCVFVLSTGRGGTETLTALAALSPTIVASHEPRPRLIKASYDAYLAGPGIARDAAWRALALASRDDMVWDAVQRGKVFVETNNRITYLAPALAEVFPASRFIHVYRDPFAFVRSAMRRRYFAGHNWDFARVRPRPGEALAEVWDTLHRIECCAWLWWRTNRDAADWLRTLPAQRRLTIRSEQLFAGDPETIQQYFTICGSSVPAPEQIRSVLEAKLNAQTAGDFPIAGAWSVEDQARVWKHVGALAEEVGYSRS